MSDSQRPFSAREFLVGGLLCIAGFVMTATAVHLALGQPLYLYAIMRSEKLLMMQHFHGSAFSAVFGSSHVNNAFVPEVFDRGLAGTPAETRTLNLAISGGSQVEQRATALEFLHGLQAPPAASAGPRTCLVLLELGAGANMGTNYMVHPRTINLYDWKSVRLVSQLTDRQLGWSRSTGRIGFAAAASAMYYMNVGMVSNAIFRPPMNAKREAEALSPTTRGVLLMQSDPKAQQKLAAIINSSPKVPRVTSGELLPGNVSLIDELRAASPVHPLQFAYIEMPMLSNLSFYEIFPPEIETAGGPVPILNVARPDLYPELYQVQNWHDDAHLDQQGAELATAIIARQLTAWYAAHGWPPRCEE